MPRFSLPGVLAIIASATPILVVNAEKFEYTNLRRDVYLNLIGQKASFDSSGRTVLKEALDRHGPAFVDKFTSCFTQFSYGDVQTMSEPEWTVYSESMQYPNDTGDGYVQQIKFTVGTFVVVAEKDLTDVAVTKCARRAFNIGKSEFVPLLQEADLNRGVFGDVGKAKVLALAEFTPPPSQNGGSSTPEQIEAEFANDLLADSELIEDDDDDDDDDDEDDPEPTKSPVAAPTKIPVEVEKTTPANLSRCPVKVRVDCTSPDGKTDCNDIPQPENPDCKIKVKYTYYFKVNEEIRLKSAKRYRKEALLGCDNNFKGCPIRDYMTEYKNKYVRVGTEFDAWEEVCEDTRHDTRFEIRGQRETYSGSHEWVDCIVTDDYEDNVWTKNKKATYLDLIKTNKVEGDDVETDEPTASPTKAPTSSPTLSPTATPTASPVKDPTTASPITASPITASPITASPVASPTEADVEVFIEPEETRCTQLALTIACTTIDGIGCNDVPKPRGDASDPCTIDVKYIYSVKNVGNYGTAEFSMLMRSRTSSSDIDFLPYFGTSPFRLSKSYGAREATMTERVSVDFCEPQAHVTALVAESTMRGGECNSVEEYLLLTPVEVPGLGGAEEETDAGDAIEANTENSEDGFNNQMDPSQVSKNEGREEVEEEDSIVTVQVGTSDGDLPSVSAMMQAEASSASASAPFVGYSIWLAACLFFML